ncbi:MAG: hypothetical protein HYW07_01455 [Candidatus Latescibacteria bacterium]|nr:hypothetical protein [Candidatus Latescibacterota bacterium]
MFGGSGKRAFERTRISVRERLIGGGILLLLAGIGAGVYLKGRRFDPALFSLDPALLASGKAARLPVPLAGEEGEDAAGRAPAVSEVKPATASVPGRRKELLADLAPAGWRPQGGIERFSADDLYVKINGRAEQYLAYAVVDLKCAGLADDKGRFIDIFVYDMGEPIRAFGIFSVERPPEAAALELGRHGYQSGASYFFWKGRHYVQVVAGGEGEELERAGLQIARQVAGRLENQGEALWGESALPAAGQVPGSLQYFMRDALSLDFLGETFVARYRKGGKELIAFLSRQESPEKANQVMDKYSDYVGEYGRIVAIKVAEGDLTMYTAELGGFFDVVFRTGVHVGGVSQAEDREQAGRLAAEVLRSAGD